MKRILTLLLSLMLAVPATLAEEVVLSPELTAQKLAIHAMYEKYGFTAATVGTFTPLITIAEDETRVLFHSYFLPSSRLGEYEAVIKGSDVSLTWSHDDKDLSAWTAGDPECPYWGAAQVEAYAARGIGLRDDWIKDYYAEEEEPQEDPMSSWMALSLSAVQEKEDDLPPKEARHIASAAMMDVYGLTAEAVDDLYAGSYKQILVTPDGSRYREVYFADLFMGFAVLVNAETSEVFHIYLFAGGNG